MDCLSPTSNPLNSSRKLPFTLIPPNTTQEYKDLLKNINKVHHHFIGQGFSQNITEKSNFGTFASNIYDSFCFLAQVPPPTTY